MTQYKIPTLRFCLEACEIPTDGDLKFYFVESEDIRIDRSFLFDGDKILETQDPQKQSVRSESYAIVEYFDPKENKVVQRNMLPPFYSGNFYKTAVYDYIKFCYNNKMQPNLDHILQ